MPKLDSTITISILLAICALFAPSITALINNHHHYKMRELELTYNARMHYSDLIYKNKYEASVEDSVVRLQLMPCIKNYIHDERLVTLACASAWIGNDETHYQKRHSSYTLNNLRIFINAFVTFVDADLAYEAAKQLTSD